MPSKRLDRLKDLYDDELRNIRYILNERGKDPDDAATEWSHMPPRFSIWRHMSFTEECIARDLSPSEIALDAVKLMPIACEGGTVKEFKAKDLTFYVEYHHTVDTYSACEREFYLVFSDGIYDLEEDT